MPQLRMVYAERPQQALGTERGGLARNTQRERKTSQTLPHKGRILRTESSPSQKIDLVEVNLYQSQEMIYNELGVYPKRQYYTACDPYFLK